MKTVYLQSTYTEKGYNREYARHMRLGMRPNTHQQRYVAAKKENGVWVGVDAIVNHKCKCGGSHFEFWYNQTEERNIFVYKCTQCRNETITINSYEVPTPDQPLGRWVKQNGKWFVKVISGNTSTHEEIMIRSSKGLQRKKISKVSIL